MLREAFITVIVVFAYPLGGQIQGPLAALVLIFGIYFHQVCARFREEFHRLNCYESISLLVSMNNKPSAKISFYLIEKETSTC